MRSSGRTILTEYESKKLLESYGIPSVPTEIADSEDAAEEAAAAIGYPVVLKLHSFTITHKTDVGGVVLNLPDAASVRHAFAQIRESRGGQGRPGPLPGRHRAALCQAWMATS